VTFQLVRDKGQREERVKIVEDLELELSDLHDTNYELGSMVEESASRILQIMQQQLDVVDMMEE
jgi:uncharacterized protein YlaN (UPF0358 family)